MPTAPNPTVAPVRLDDNRQALATRQPTANFSTGSDSNRACLADHARSFSSKNGRTIEGRMMAENHFRKHHSALPSFCRFLVLLLFCPIIAAAQINITQRAQDFSLSTNGLLRITMTPIARAGDYTNAYLLPTPLRPDIFTNGTAIFSNKVAGYAYSVAFET